MLVSVHLLTYNHEIFIRQAIESVLAQKTNFDYEIIIGDDCSKDRNPPQNRHLEQSRDNLWFTDNWFIL